MPSATTLLLAMCIHALALTCACSDDASVDEDAPCREDYPSFRPGMSVNAGALTVKLLSISPEPPRQKVKNDWTLQVVDASGAPVSDLTLANPDSYMPLHRHHGKTLPNVITSAEPGKAQLTGIDFIMRGPWQVLFDVLQGGTKTGTATFQICVE